MEYKEGATLVPKEGWRAYNKVVLRGRNFLNGKEYWWAEVFESDESWMSTFAKGYFKDWKEEVQFFKMGHAYKWRTSESHKYLIQELYSVEDPESPEESMAAVALVTNPFGKKYMAVLDLGDFNQMTQVTG